MDLYTKTKQCDLCRLFLSFSEFYKNKAKKDGFQNRCKDCIKDYKEKLSKGLIEKQTLLPRNSYFIPDIYLVGIGRTQTYQNCCLSCEEGFFCMKTVREYEDLFCSFCTPQDIKLSERNYSKNNYIGNVIGWIVKVESIKKNRSHRNYKKCYQRDGYTCRYCGYNLKDAITFLPLHIDHIKPWSSQGGNGLNNLVVSCEECNLLVCDKIFSNFEEKKEFIIFEKEKRKFRKTYLKK